MKVTQSLTRGRGKVLLKFDEPPHEAIKDTLIEMGWKALKGDGSGTEFSAQNIEAYARYGKELAEQLHSLESFWTVGIAASHAPTENNIGLDHHSYVEITHQAEDGPVTVGYVLFDQNAKVARFIADHYAKRNYPATLIKVGVYPRDRREDAREALNQGRVLKDRVAPVPPEGVLPVVGAAEEPIPDPDNQEKASELSASAAEPTPEYWTMTLEDFERHLALQAGNLAVDANSKTKHKAYVLEAIQAGKPVTEAVAQAYPDLLPLIQLKALSPNIVVGGITPNQPPPTPKPIKYGKEPWELTRDEWLSQRTLEKPEGERGFDIKDQEEHQRIIREAIQQGEDVPQTVFTSHLLDPVREVYLFQAAPHELSLAEYQERMQKLPPARWQALSVEERAAWAQELHRMAVLNALIKEQAVPDPVLAEYPDFQPGAILRISFQETNLRNGEDLAFFIRGLAYRNVAHYGTHPTEEQQVLYLWEVEEVYIYTTFDPFQPENENQAVGPISMEGQRNAVLKAFRKLQSQTEKQPRYWPSFIHLDPSGINWSRYQVEAQAHTYPEADFQEEYVKQQQTTGDARPPEDGTPMLEEATMVEGHNEAGLQKWAVSPLVALIQGEASPRATDSPDTSSFSVVYQDREWTPRFFHQVLRLIGFSGKALVSRQEEGGEDLLIRIAGYGVMLEVSQFPEATTILPFLKISGKYLRVLAICRAIALRKADMLPNEQDRAQLPGEATWNQYSVDSTHWGYQTPHTLALGPYKIHELDLVKQWEDNRTPKEELGLAGVRWYLSLFHAHIMGIEISEPAATYFNWEHYDYVSLDYQKVQGLSSELFHKVLTTIQYEGEAYQFKNPKQDPIYRWEGKEGRFLSYSVPPFEGLMSFRMEGDKNQVLSLAKAILAQTGALPDRFNKGSNIVDEEWQPYPFRLEESEREEPTPVEPSSGHLGYDQTLADFVAERLANPTEEERFETEPVRRKNAVAEHEWILFQNLMLEIPIEAHILQDYPHFQAGGDLRISYDQVNFMNADNFQTFLKAFDIPLAPQRGKPLSKAAHEAQTAWRWASEGLTVLTQKNPLDHAGYAGAMVLSAKQEVTMAAYRTIAEWWKGTPEVGEVFLPLKDWEWEAAQALDLTFLTLYERTHETYIRSLDREQKQQELWTGIHTRIHEKAVFQALIRGKEVPDTVRAYYPHFAPDAYLTAGLPYSHFRDVERFEHFLIEARLGKHPEVSDSEYQPPKYLWEGTGVELVTGSNPRTQEGEAAWIGLAGTAQRVIEVIRLLQTYVHQYAHPGLQYIDFHHFPHRTPPKPALGNPWELRFMEYLWAVRDELYREGRNEEEVFKEANARHAEAVLDALLADKSVPKKARAYHQDITKWDNFSVVAEQLRFRDREAFRAFLAAANVPDQYYEGYTAQSHPPQAYRWKGSQVEIHMLEHPLKSEGWANHTLVFGEEGRVLAAVRLLKQQRYAALYPGSLGSCYASLEWRVPKEPVFPHQAEDTTGTNNHQELRRMVYDALPEVRRKEQEGVRYIDLYGDDTPSMISLETLPVSDLFSQLPRLSYQSYQGTLAFQVPAKEDTEDLDKAAYKEGILSQPITRVDGQRMQGILRKLKAPYLEIEGSFYRLVRKKKEGERFFVVRLPAMADLVKRKHGKTRGTVLYDSSVTSEDYLDTLIATAHEAFAQDKRLTKGQVEAMGHQLNIPNQGLLWEGLELAWGIWYRRLYRTAGTMRQVLEAMAHFWYKVQPTYQYSDSNKENYKQYSTPCLIGAIVAQYTHMATAQRILEPSAGNGLFLVGADPKKVTANEIDETRRTSLEYLGFGEITHHNASEPLPENWYRAFDVMVTNPPFATWEESTAQKMFIVREYFNGYMPMAKYLRLEQVMACLALHCLKSDGRAALILQGHIAFNEDGLISRYRPFLNWLYAHYWVDDIVNLNGYKLYNKQGATKECMLILIRGRKAQAKGVAPTRDQAPRMDVLANTFRDVWERVVPHLNSDFIDINTQLKKYLDR